MPIEFNRKALRSYLGGFFGSPLPRILECRLLPKAVLTSEGKIREPFLGPIAQKAITELSPQGGRTEQDLIAGLKEHGLVAVEGIDPEQVYRTILREKVMGLKFADLHVKARTRFVALQTQINEFGLKSKTNQEIAASCIREALGFSGVQVYTVDQDKITWKHCFSAGVQGRSRFEKARSPEKISEENFLVRLMRNEVPAERIDQAKAAGLFEWQFSGEWGYLHISDRSKCDFVDQEQLRKDELGDPEQHREGYGEGRCREKLYLVCGQGEDAPNEVFLINNWNSGKSLFGEKKRDLESLRTFAVSYARAKALSAAHHKLENISVHDPLTGLPNRRFFESKIKEEVLRVQASRQARPLGILVFDIDLFKEINDSPEQGHDAGDHILREISKIFLEQVRGGIDSIVRYGGDEFVAILPETDAEGSGIVAERIRAAVEAHEFIFEGKKIQVTVSIGGSTYAPEKISTGTGSVRLPAISIRPPSTDEVEDTIAILFRRADRALYDAKDRGRNQVVIKS